MRIVTTGRILPGAAVAVCLAASACRETPRHNEKKAMNNPIEAPEPPAGPVVRSDDQWREKLTPEQYRILRRSGTEHAWGKIYKEFKHQGAGTYYCAGCGAELFSSAQKFDARCGWPAFFDASKHENLKTLRDPDGMRVEVRCKVCDGHLGHLFEGEGFDTPTDQRYCINGTVLVFVPEQTGKPGKPAKPGGGD